MTQAAHTKNAVPAASATFLEDLATFLREEDAERFTDMFVAFVALGGIHATGAGLTKTPDTLTAYVGGRLIAETGSIVYPDNDTGWVIAHKDLTGNIATFTRVVGTHYLIDFASPTKPTLPADATWLMEVTTAGGSVTAVTDLRARVPNIDVFDNQAALPTAGRRGKLAFTRAEVLLWLDTGSVWSSFTGDAELVAARDGEPTLADRLNDFEVLTKLTNRTGGALAANDVVTVDPANDTSVTVGNVQGSRRPFLVAHETIANGVLGRFRVAGKTTVKVNGVVARGNYLRKSATSLALEDAGVVSTAAPPPETVGVALTAAVGPGIGSVIAWLFGAPKAGFESGTRLVFDQDTAPTGWTRDATVDDRVIRIQGSGARVHGGAWAITGLTHTHTHTATTGAPSAAVGADEFGGGGVAAHSSHTHTLTSDNPSTAVVASDGTWRPLHRSMILASKD